MKAGQFSSQWLKSNMADCNKEGYCNFTTIGDIFELLGDAKYYKRGVYKRYDLNRTW